MDADAVSDPDLLMKCVDAAFAEVLALGKGPAAKEKVSP
jgi:hypothetical protein